jgi:hypothetical protein
MRKQPPVTETEPKLGRLHDTAGASLTLVAIVNGKVRGGAGRADVVRWRSPPDAHRAARRVREELLGVRRIG